MKGRTLIAVCAVTLASATFALADEWNRKIEITFNQPVAIPAVHLEGMDVLPPGTYVFKILDTMSDRHIVQIFNKDENKIYATVLAIPNLRLKVTDKPVITFRETAAGEPFALRAMFYPGRAWGEEFVYPKKVATELAKATAGPVLAMPETTEAAPEAPAVVSELKQAPITAVKPSGEEVQEAEVVLPPAPFSANELPRELPKTASPLPLLALMGLGALLAGAALRPVAERDRNR